jgi:putative tricarboxylic transport membrane protein
VFLLAATNLVAVPIRTGLDIGADKFIPLGAIGFDLNSIAVAENSPYRTLKDFLTAAREKPNTISVGTTSPGGGAHALIYRLGKLTGARFNIVSFKSGAESVTAVMGGHIQATAENLGEVLPQVEAKKLRFLGIPAAKRLPALPNVPTLKEQGFDIHEGALRAFVSPAGIPREAAKTLEDTLAKVYKSAGWRDYMARNMYEDVYMNGDDFGRWLAAQQVYMRDFLTEIGLANKK